MRILLISIFALIAVACSHNVALNNTRGELLANAKVQLDGNESGLISLERNGVTYQGSWVASKVDESRMIAKTYGVHSKRYKDYQHGLGTYLRVAESTLTSSQGAVLACTFKYRGTNANGLCKSDSETFEFMANEQ